STWLLWGTAILIIASFARKLPMRGLLWPLAPYLGWLILYFVWGSILVDWKYTHFAVKTLVTTCIIGASMAVLTASPRNLRAWATAAQFAAIANIVVLFVSSWSSQVNAIVQIVTARSAAMEGGFQRYGGLSGNPNLLAFICLSVVILSAFAVPWIAWAGRLSCLPLFYLSASRKGILLLILIVLLYMLLVQARNLRFWLGGAIAALTLVFAFAISGTLQRESRSATDNAYVARMMDLKENYAAEHGAETRIDLLNEWLAVAAREPWYGYGLNAMTGTQFDEDNPSQVSQKGLVENGTHNTYLGIWIDVGPFGFLVFMAMLALYVTRCFTARCAPTVKWMLISFAAVNLVFLAVSHSQLMSFEGEIVCTLLFLLPTSPAVRAQRWELAFPS
ncbi:MAG: hypothetical protein HGA66_06615, partial [Holophaga sp.]|nr:hypothetical protein [Holophaga sp.]